MRQLLGFAVAAAMLSPIADHGATVEVNGSVVEVTGQFQQGDAFLVKQAIEADPIQKVKAIKLDSPGGLVSEGLGMGTLVEFYHLDSIVANGAMCASACFLPFAAGAHKTVGQSARIGIHSATSHPDHHGDDDGQATMEMARYAARFGVPAAIVGRMVITSAADMAWLNDADLHTMDVSRLASAPLQHAAVAKPAGAGKPTGQSKGFFAYLFTGEGGATASKFSSPAAYSSLHTLEWHTQAWQK